MLGGDKIDQSGQQFRIEGVGGHNLPTLGMVIVELEMIGKDTSMEDSKSDYTHRPNR